MTKARDWLDGFYPACRLCGVEDIESGYTECASTIHRITKGQVGAYNVCWWCFYRFCTWMNRKLVTCKMKNDLLFSEFLAHAMSTKPKWLGNPSAYHPKRPLSSEEKRARNLRAKKRAEENRRERLRSLIRFAKWLKSRPADEHDFHKRSCLVLEDIRPETIKKSVLQRMIKDGVVEFFSDGETTVVGTAGWTA